ncbi:hypothetical protein [Paenibacillus typhae]|uniref:hypothetical protein n=1 Tax=Paenibacillus typhae TaxID=1174501 RepID=UPI0039F0D18B
MNQKVKAGCSNFESGCTNFEWSKGSLFPKIGGELTTNLRRRQIMKALLRPAAMM